MALPLLYQTPNKFAPPPSLSINNGLAEFRGYQEFFLLQNPLRVVANSDTLKRKQELLSPLFSPPYLKHRTVLDIGANAGFFSFWALQEGAKSVTALDIDETYLDLIKDAKRKFEINSLELSNVNFVDWDRPVDCVFALALVHWVYSCTDLTGSLDTLIAKISSLTKYMLIIEWVDPADPAIQFFHHLDSNKDQNKEPYTFDAFEQALKTHFARYEYVGEISSTRKLYNAFANPLTQDFSTPLPLIHPREKIIYSHQIAYHNNIDYWSVVYDIDEGICKQTTLSLAERECYFLSLLKSDYFPKAKSLRTKVAYSVVVMEKIFGEPLLDTANTIRDTLESLLDFMIHCLNLLTVLRDKGITHRDIRLENIIVRQNKPVLIDFGWAVSASNPIFSPSGLGEYGRPPDGSFCDIYSMGKVFESLNKHKYYSLGLVIALMTEPDSDLRITNLDVLRKLFMSAAKSSFYDTVDEGGTL